MIHILDKRCQTFFYFAAPLKTFQLSDEAANYIKTGRIGVCGRDRDGNPGVIIRFKGLKINKNTNMDVLDALKFVFMVMKKYMMVPYYCELFN